MREGWKKYKLGDVARLLKKQYSPNKEDDLAYIGLEHIEQQTLRLNGIGKSSKVTSQKFRFSSGDILFGKLRPYFRKVYRPKFDGVCSTDIWVVRAKEGFEQSFLFYFMANQDFINESNSGSSGTRMPRADWDHLSKTEWNIPESIETQRRIASILSTLDDKIELNRQTNQTLEAIAQAIYTEWFVNFNFPTSEGNPYRDSGGEMQDSELGLIPKGWRVGKLGDLLSFRNGKSSPERNNINGYPVYGANGVIGFASIYNSTDRTIIIGRVGSYCGAIYYTTQKAFVTENAIIAEAYNQNSSLFSFFLMERLNLNNYKVGSGQPLLNQTILEGIDVLLPYKDIVDKFEGVLLPHFINIQYNEQQSSTILTIRNALLPKLMTGEIEV